MVTAVANTVLLVDDEEDVREVMRISLEDLGYEVLCAEDGEKAVALFKAHAPPIVLTDIRMPNMDGIELLEKIKRINPETEVIMITGHGDMNFAVQSFRFDATDFITKPIGMEALERALKRASDKIRIRRQFYEYTWNLEARLSEKSPRTRTGEAPGTGEGGGPATAPESINTDPGVLQQALDNLPCYIIVYDAELRVIRANPYFVDRFGEAAGEYCYVLCRRREEPCPDCPVKKTFSRGKSCQHETEYITSDDQVRKVLVWTLPVFDSRRENVEQVVAVATDLEQVSELQDHLSSLGLLMGSLSHGIKGLLTGLDSGMYLINSGLKKENSEQTEEGLKIVQETTSRLKKVVLDILFYAKEREFKKEKLPVRTFADDLSNVVAPRIKAYGITYHKEYADELGEFEIDVNCMIQAIMNIFENAMNACLEDKADKSAAGHEITLAARPENGRVCLVITDNGKGMDEATRNSMFDLFFSTRGSKGTGLGLFITRKIVEDHGGTIQVESEPGQGTSVSVCVPRA